MNDLVTELTARIVGDALSRGVTEISIRPSAPAPAPDSGAVRAADAARPGPPDGGLGAEVRFRVGQEARPVLIVPGGELAMAWAEAAGLGAGVRRGRMRVDLGGGGVAELEVAQGASPDALTLTVVGVSRRRGRVPRWAVVTSLAVGALLAAVSLPSAVPGERWWLGALLAPGLALLVARWVTRPWAPG